MFSLVNELMKCQGCEAMFGEDCEAFLLPCDIFCDKCTKETMANTTELDQEFECLFCAETHLRPSNGFKKFNKLTQKTPLTIMSKLSTNLTRVNALNDLNLYESSDLIKEKIDEQRDLIQKRTESLVWSVKQLGAEKIKSLDILEENFSSFMRDQFIEEANILKSELINCIERFELITLESDLLNTKTMEFLKKIEEDKSDLVQDHLVQIEKFAAENLKEIMDYSLKLTNDYEESKPENDLIKSELIDQVISPPLTPQPKPTAQISLLSNQISVLTLEQSPIEEIEQNSSIKSEYELKINSPSNTKIMEPLPSPLNTTKSDDQSKYFYDVKCLSDEENWQIQDIPDEYLNPNFKNISKDEKEDSFDDFNVEAESEYICQSSTPKISKEAPGYEETYQYEIPGNNPTYVIQPIENLDLIKPEIISTSPIDIKDFNLSSIHELPVNEHVQMVENSDPIDFKEEEFPDFPIEHIQTSNLDIFNSKKIARPTRSNRIASITNLNKNINLLTDFETDQETVVECKEDSVEPIVDHAHLMELKASLKKRFPQVDQPSKIIDQRAEHLLTNFETVQEKFVECKDESVETIADHSPIAKLKASLKKRLPQMDQLSKIILGQHEEDKFNFSKTHLRSTRQPIKLVSLDYLSTDDSLNVSVPHNEKIYTPKPIDKDECKNSKLIDKPVNNFSSPIELIHQNTNEKNAIQKIIDAKPSTIYSEPNQASLYKSIKDILNVPKFECRIVKFFKLNNLIHFGYTDIKKSLRIVSLNPDLTVYRTRLIEIEAVYDFSIEAHDNKIVIYYEANVNKYLMILNDKLKDLKSPETCMHVVKSVALDKANVYLNVAGQLLGYDWEFKKCTKANCGQSSNNDKPYFMSNNTFQATLKNDKFFVLSREGFKVIDKKNGEMLLELNVKGDSFVLDSFCNVFIFSVKAKTIYKYALDGQLLDEIKLDSKSIFGFVLDDDQNVMVFN